MTHPGVVFTDSTHERVTRRIAEAYETRQQVRRSFYRPTLWADLPQDCQQEHADIATAALQGTTHNGHELPQWVKNIANTEKKGTPPMTRPKRYRKKPVVIEAIQITADNIHDVAKWCGGTPGRTFGDHPNTYTGMDIPTLEGVMSARLGDWVVKGVQGEFYPCKPDIFAATYEEVSDD